MTEHIKRPKGVWDLVGKIASVYCEECGETTWQDTWELTKIVGSRRLYAYLCDTHAFLLSEVGCCRAEPIGTGAQGPSGPEPVG